MEVKVCTNEVLIDLMFMMSNTQGRNCVTENELERYKEHIASESKENGIEVVFVHDVTDNLDKFRKAVDTVVTQEGLVYRFNFSAHAQDVSELLKLLHMYNQKSKVVTLPGWEDEEFLATLNDYTEETEKESPEFGKVDEMHQLDIMYRLYKIEREKISLELALGNLSLQASSLVDRRMVNEILMQNPDITQTELYSEIQESRK